MAASQRRNTLCDVTPENLPNKEGRNSVRRKMTSFAQRRVSSDSSSSPKFWNISIRRKQSSADSQSSLATLFANEMNTSATRRQVSEAESEDSQSGSGLFLWSFPFTLLESNEVCVLFLLQKVSSVFNLFHQNVSYFNHNCG